MNRRRFLTGAGGALTAPITGCLSRVHSSGPSQGTADLPVRFWLEEASLSASERDSVAPIVFANLSTGEREIVQTALEEGEYTVEQGSVSPPMESLRDRIEQKTGNGATLEAYLRRNDTYYRVGFADGDHIIAHPDH